MLIKIESYLNIFIGLDPLTKICILIFFALLLFFAHKFFTSILSFFIDAGLNFKIFYEFIVRCLEIFKEYELKSIAGVINFFSTILLVVMTVASFLSDNFIIKILKLETNVITLFLLLGVTIFVGIASILLLMKFDSIKKNIS